MRRAVRDEPLSAGCAPAVACVAPTLAERLCCAIARRAGTCPRTTQSPGPTSGTNSPPACSLRTLESELSSMRAGSIVSVSAQVKACELDAVIVAGNRFEDAIRDRRLRICFGVRADWMARLRGASLVGAWAWRLGFEMCAPTGGIVWRLRAGGCVGAYDGLAPMNWAAWLQERFESLLGACGLLPCCYARRDSNAPSMRAWPAEPIAQARAASSFKVSVPGWRSTWAYSDIGKSIASAHCCAVSPDISRARVSQFFTPSPFP